MYQRTWHGIELASLPAAAAAVDQPVSAAFYAQFYAALAAGRGQVDPLWIQNKRRMGEAILRDVIEPWQQSRGRSPRILAIAAGNAVTERVWHEAGHEVTFHDCQEDSLAEVRRLYPTAPRIIGDVLNLTFEAKHDLVTAITVDYVMNRRELGGFLGRLAQGLAADGQIVLYCASTLSFRQMAAETVKRVLRVYGRNPHVFWGYWRTPRGFYTAAAAAGLRVNATYQFKGAPDGRLTLCPTPALRRRLPPLRDTNLVISMEPIAA